MTFSPIARLHVFLHAAWKYLRHAPWFVTSPWFWVSYATQQMAVNLWDHDVVFAVVSATTLILNIVILLVKHKRDDEKRGVTQVLLSASIPTPDVLEELDEQFAACSRALRQEPSTDRLIEVVDDLRGIVKDLRQ